MSLDGTKLHANASRHSALSYGHAERIEAQLKAEVQELLELAETADRSALPDGVDLPEEIRRREDRLAAIAEAKAKIEARARERFEREQAEFRPSSPDARPRRRPPARSPAAGRRSRLRQARRGRPSRSTSPTKTRAS